jgi:hypothetical protein
MFARMIAVAALLASAGVALASDASYDLQQARNAKAAQASTASGAKDAAPSTAATPCGCSHGRS